MTSAAEESNRRMLRARDAIDRDYQHEMDIAALARIALVSERHFLRTFKLAFGETPHRYLQLRRVERAMYLLRHSDLSVTDTCLAVGFSSLGELQPHRGLEVCDDVDLGMMRWLTVRVPGSSQRILLQKPGPRPPTSRPPIRSVS